MKYLELILFLVVGTVECTHLFLGTNENKPLVLHKQADYGYKMFRERVENLYFTMPFLPNGALRTIQGVLAYDRTDSGASANVTQGGLGYNHINIRMKSDRGEKLHYDVYIYA